MSSKKNTIGSEKQLQTHISQLTIQRDLAQSNAKELGKASAKLQACRLGMCDSLMIEKLDLMGRIARIDQRIGAFGLEQPAALAVDLDLNRAGRLCRMF